MLEPVADLVAMLVEIMVLMVEVVEDTVVMVEAEVEPVVEDMVEMEDLIMEHRYNMEEEVEDILVMGIEVGEGEVIMARLWESVEEDMQIYMLMEARQMQYHVMEFVLSSTIYKLIF